MFNRPVREAKVEIEGISEPFGSTNGHLFKSGLRVESLDTVSLNSRIILGPEGHQPIDADNVLRFQITEIGAPFGGPYRPWGPKDALTITVRSNQDVKLIGIVSGSGRTFLPEHMSVTQP